MPRTFASDDAVELAAAREAALKFAARWVRTWYDGDNAGVLSIAAIFEGFLVRYPVNGAFALKRAFKISTVNRLPVELVELAEGFAAYLEHGAPESADA